MSGTPWSTFSVGDEVANEKMYLTRESLVRYAGASGDFNPIHYRDDVAQSVGLEGVLAHGMLTMGLAIAPVTSWLAGKAMVTSYQVRFTKPVYIPLTGSAGVTVSVTLQSLGEAPEESATLALRVTNDEGTTVLGKAIAVVSTL